MESMQLFINDEEIDVEFETEKTLIDVYQSIEAQAAEHNRYILDCKVENRDVSREYLEKTLLTTVESMQFWVGDTAAMLLQTARTMDGYIDQVGGTLYESETISQDQIDDLQSGVRWIGDFISSAASLLDFEPDTFSVPMPDGSTSEPVGLVYQNLQKEVTKLKAGQVYLSAIVNAMRVIKSFTGRLLVHLHAELMSVEGLQQGLDKFMVQLSDLSQRIVKVNEAYQSGRDDEALQVLDQLLQELDQHMSYLFGALERIDEADRKTKIKADDEETIEEVALSLMQRFVDLAGALEDNDMVAMGDILEYELADEVAGLAPLLQQLKKLLPHDDGQNQS